MKQKYFLLSVLVGTMFSVNVLAVPGPLADQGCPEGTYIDGGVCKLCPSNYNNHFENFSYEFTAIESCCIGELTYDANTDMCVSVAQGLTNSSTCDTENLGTSTDGSTASVEAVWDANTININWYNGDTRVAQTTCTYDGQISLPTEPTKPGYTFSGWRLKNN